MEVSSQYSEGENRYLGIRAISIAEIPSGPGGEEMTSQEFLSILFSDVETIEEQQLDTSEPLLYGVGTTVGDGQTVYIGAWTVPNGSFVYSVNADTAEVRTELAHAFIEACNEVG